jgi:transcriptional regulator with XRE-family HTH domain
MVGKRVRQTRVALHMTQMDLAEKARITQSTISGIEVGRRPGDGITLGAARRLARALCVTLDALAGSPLDGDEVEDSELLPAAEALV